MALDTIAYYVSGGGYEEGEILEPGNWGSVLQRLGVLHTRYNVEMLFETIRQSEFPSKPSRLLSNFLWATEKEACWYRDSHHREDNVYEVRFDQSFNWHQGVFLCIPPHPVFSEEETIRHYWSFDHLVTWEVDPTFVPYEIVTLSPFRIVRQLG